MATNVPLANCAKDCINQRVDRHIGIAVPGQSVAVIDFHPAKPQFLAGTEPMDIVTRSNTQRRKRGFKIAGESQLMQAFVSFDQGNGQSRGTSDLGVVAGFIRSVPVPVRSPDIAVSESLRSLHAPQQFAAGRLRHQATLSFGQAIHYRQDRNGAGMVRQRINQTIEHSPRKDRPRGIMNQDKVWSARFECSKPEAYRIPPRRSTGHQHDPRNAGEAFRGKPIGAIRNGDDDRTYSCCRQRFSRMANYRLAAPPGELLGQGLSRAQPLPGRDDDGSDAWDEGG